MENLENIKEDMPSYSSNNRKENLVDLAIALGIAGYVFYRLSVSLPAITPRIYNFCSTLYQYLQIPS